MLKILRKNDKRGVRARLFLSAASLLGLFSSQQGIVAAPATTANSSIVLHFPEESVGTLFSLKPKWSINDNPIEMKPLGLARGTVRIASDNHLSFKPNGNLTNHPEVLNGPFLEHLELLQPSGLDINDKLMAGIGRCVYLRRLDFNESEIDDASLKYLKSLTRLEALSLAKILIKGSGLGNLSTMKSLLALNLSGNSLEPGCLALLQSPPKVSFLGVSHARITDKDIKDIAAMPNVNVLDLSANSDITDSGIKFLSGKKSIQYLNVEDTGVTLKGLSELKLPGLTTMVISQRMQKYKSFEILKKAFPKITIAAPDRSHHEALEFFK